jgi:DNA-binding transcriptional MerR regulator
LWVVDNTGQNWDRIAIDSGHRSYTIWKVLPFPKKRERQNMFKTKKGRPESTVAAGTYTSSEVSRIAGVSLRQLQWWDERKVVSPRHEGHKRVFSPDEVIEITVIAELRRKGFSLQKIRRVLRFLQKEMDRRLSDVMQGQTDLHLVTDGKSIYLEDQSERIIDILKNARQPMFLVCVTDQVRRLNEPVKKPVRAESPTAVKRARVG